MRLLLLADINSSHTKKWIQSFAQKNLDLFLYSHTAPKSSWYKNIAGLTCFVKNIYKHESGFISRIIMKVIYLFQILCFRRLVQKIKPDIIHAHYATSYGLMAALSGFPIKIISVWGSDVFHFPRQSRFHKMLLKYNLKNSTAITSTSHIMANETKNYTTNHIHVIPFGVDTNFFKPLQIPGKDEFIIGTVKRLEKHYGVDLLIKAFYRFKVKIKTTNLRLVIVGDGSEYKHLKKMARNLLNDEDYHFAGFIPDEQVPYFFNKMSVVCYLSRNSRESFCVSAVEAMSCGRPVIAFAVGGLTEVIIDKQTGILVPENNIDLAVDALKKIFYNPVYAKQLGKNARQHVLNNYIWEDSVIQMQSLYKQVLKPENHSKI